ncbi:hypothetical protein [Roseobacter weihaiensis]|uniref:hypothetical protein n=1 Tax=Roseobacter weihaiensis TaxID=2763262 RepID=UPI001D0A4E2F|nr:hypothetical protein [Roseobacter sp. H9]
MRVFFILSVATCLSACVPLPDVPAPTPRIDNTAGYPDFVPLDQIAAPTADAQRASSETEEAVEARVAALRSRAARLRQASVN